MQKKFFCVQVLLIVQFDCLFEEMWACLLLFVDFAAIGRYVAAGSACSSCVLECRCVRIDHPANRPLGWAKFLIVKRIHVYPFLFSPEYCYLFVFSQTAWLTHQTPSVLTWFESYSKPSSNVITTLVRIDRYNNQSTSSVDSCRYSSGDLKFHLVRRYT